MSDSPLQGHARLAGLMYLVVMASFIAPYAMVSAIVVPGDFAQTARNVAASETLYRAALVIQALGCAAIIVLSGALYALLRHLNAPLALASSSASPRSRTTSASTPLGLSPNGKR